MDFSRYLSPSAYHEGTMKACRLHRIGEFTTDDVSIPKPVGNQLLLKVEGCGVCGSDIPRIFKLGTSKQRYPLTIGHEFGGTIVEVVKDADKSLVGKRGAIFPCIPCRKCDACLSANYAMCEDYDYLGSRSDGGFAEYCLVPSAWHFVPSTNPDTPGEALAMTEPCTVAQHAVRKGGVTAGMNVLIMGAGPIGIMVARWAKLFGASVVLSEIVEEKCEFARAHGCEVIDSKEVDLVECVRELTHGRGVDVAIEGTGSGSGLGQAIECTRTFGTVVMMGNPASDTTIKLTQHSQILRKELSLKGIWNSHYADTPINEWHYTVRMLDEGKMQVTDLITHKSSLDGLPALCSGINDHSILICKAMYVPEAE
ncbi:MAG: galactitol-1-phosphate 5-dehydrogenase [Olsenella sp.]|jgi:L-iditol 2-dehydrogenase|nr:galactitol-1-phosphate 5-dehydrogenase [Olsenella sp.]